MKPVARSARMVGGFHRILGTKECQHQGIHPQALLVNQIRNVLRKWEPGSTVFLLASRRTEIAKYARVPSLQRAPCKNALVMQYQEQNMLVTWWRHITKFSVKADSRHNHRYAVVVQELATQWIPVVSVCNQNFSEDGNEFTKVSRAVGDARKSFDNSLDFGKACEELSWNHCTSTPHPFRDKWYC